MHSSPAVKLGCTDCHGGNASALTKNEAHVQPRFPELWPTSANPPRTYTALLRESPEFVKFINPGDLRVAQETCGGCHQKQVNAVPRSTMTTSAIFWSAVSYANGIVGTKPAFLGESYSRDGNAQSIKPVRPPTAEEIAKGARPLLVPLPRWEITQPGEYFRAFERGGIANNTTPPEIGNPAGGDEAGKPDIRLGNRGRGTGLRITPGLINLHKTRLNDPHLSFLGTNDHPGDYRSSGCTACHVVYANDRDPLHSASYAQFGNTGLSITNDPTIPKNEKGHPLRHQFTRAVPTSQCMSCHMHQPNSFVNTYLGYTMWDYETDAQLLWPKQQKYPTEAEKRASLDHNPEGAAPRGLWTDIPFLENVTSLNKDAKQTQFADYHGHGWNFMAVFKRDRKGNLLDANDQRVAFDDPDKFKKAVHLRDIHLEKGMHCTDCHFAQDEHGNGQLYGEYGNNIEIECQDCHGNATAYTNLLTSGPAAPKGGTDLRMGTTPFGQRRFLWFNGKLFQRSMVNPGMEWEVAQVKDSITPGHARFNQKAYD
ncbi:MAG TPA: cytochrome c3 family protein, partial [Thermoanaerobaculia bacterium]|nr:cytochrome c3 family protein [Thermoanaerobaculia bacterium]